MARASLRAMRGHFFRLTSLASLIASVAVPAAAIAAPKPWLPVGKWGFDTAKERCATAHNFASGDKSFVLGITLTPMWDSADLQLVVPGKYSGIWLDEVRLSAGQLRKRDTARVSSSAKPNHTLYEIAVSRAELNQIATAQSMAISSSEFRAQIPMQGMQEALTALDRCMSDLLQRWGLSKADQSRLAQFPKPEKGLKNYVSSIDFPVSAENRLAVGAIEARVAIAADGSPSNCTILRSSGHADLDAMTCKVALRPRYNPATDRNGNPMASPFYFKITWTIGR